MLAACQTLYFTMVVRHKCLIHLCSMLMDVQNGILDLLLQLKSKYKCDLKLETCEECFDVIWNWNNKKLYLCFWSLWDTEKLFPVSKVDSTNRSLCLLNLYLIYIHVLLAIMIFLFLLTKVDEELKEYSYELFKKNL